MYTRLEVAKQARLTGSKRWQSTCLPIPTSRVRDYRHVPLHQAFLLFSNAVLEVEFRSLYLQGNLYTQISPQSTGFLKDRTELKTKLLGQDNELPSNLQFIKILKRFRLWLGCSEFISCLQQSEYRPPRALGSNNF